MVDYQDVPERPRSEDVSMNDVFQPNEKEEGAKGRLGKREGKKLR